MDADYHCFGAIFLFEVMELTGAMTVIRQWIASISIIRGSTDADGLGFRFSC